MRRNICIDIVAFFSVFLYLIFIYKVFSIPLLPRKVHSALCILDLVLLLEGLLEEGI